MGSPVSRNSIWLYSAGAKICNRADLTMGLQGYEYGREKSEMLLYPTGTIITGNNYLTENLPRGILHTKFVKQISSLCSDVPSAPVPLY